MGVNSSPAPAAPTFPPRGVEIGQPGSNGFWRREVFRVPGASTWTAKKAGRIKIQALGAASGGCGANPGNSGAWGEKTLTVAVGDQITVVMGAGGDGASQSNSPGPNAQSTSFSGGPIGAVPLVLVGAEGVAAGLVGQGAAGTPTGPWDRSFSGARPTAARHGSPASASPFGPGVANANNGNNFGAPGWGGPSSNGAGASSHRPNLDAPAGGNERLGAGALTLRPTTAADPIGRSGTFWDMSDIEGSGGFYPGSASARGNDGGAGAGGSGGQPGGVSPIGGGTGSSGTTSSSPNTVKSGYGAAGAASGQATDQGGRGGDAFAFIFWDEVQ